MEVFVDSNTAEDWVAHLLAEQLEIQVKRAALPVGDVLFELPGVARVCIERKAKNDLAQSIQTGHFERQRARMEARGGGMVF